VSEAQVERSVSGHYGWSGLMETIEEEIRRHGIEPRDVTIGQLAPVDNYHWLRLAGTLALADAAAITAGDRVLDVGGGIGGPARQIASRSGCHVTVLDVTEEYCAVGEKLTEWTRLTDQVTFVHGSALAMPLPDAGFDVVWTQHATMNIPDKPRLYGEIARTVRPGGRFAMFDVLAGPQQPIHFPVPWASEQSFSFLATPEETRDLVTRAGFRELTWMTDEDEAMATALSRPDPLGEPAAAGEGLNPGLLNGPDGPRMGANVQRNMDEGRIRFAMGVFERV
jgi:SAM-dependent methyltransferase